MKSMRYRKEVDYKSPKMHCDLFYKTHWIYFKTIIVQYTYTYGNNFSSVKAINTIFTRVIKITLKALITCFMSNSDTRK